VRHGSEARFSSEHGPNCVFEHHDCALRTAISYLTARIAHDQARVKLYRDALLADPIDEIRIEAVGFAQTLALANARRNWSIDEEVA
jgi:hypothetical protein